MAPDLTKTCPVSDAENKARKKAAGSERLEQPPAVFGVCALLPFGVAASQLVGLRDTLPLKHRPNRQIICFDYLPPARHVLRRGTRHRRSTVKHRGQATGAAKTQGRRTGACAESQQFACANGHAWDVAELFTLGHALRLGVCSTHTSAPERRTQRPALDATRIPCAVVVGP